MSWGKQACIFCSCSNLICDKCGAIWHWQRFRCIFLVHFSTRCLMLVPSKQSDDTDPIALAVIILGCCQYLWATFWCLLALFKHDSSQPDKCPNKHFVFQPTPVGSVHVDSGTSAITRDSHVHRDRPSQQALRNQVCWQRCLTWHLSEFPLVWRTETLCQ